jgi:aquaporin Z
MKKYLSEFIGTFLLVFCGTGAIVIDEVTNGAVGHIGIGITFGLIVTVVILAFDNISGAHINPAATITFSLLKKLERKWAVGYILAQISGAILASLLMKLLFPSNQNLGATTPHGLWITTFILEIILTYILMLIVIMVSQSADYKKFTPIATGATVMLEAIFAGPITGASMNPARSIGPALVSLNITSLWIYITSPLIGAVLASCTWLYLFSDETSI